METNTAALIAGVLGFLLVSLYFLIVKRTFQYLSNNLSRIINQQWYNCKKQHCSCRPSFFRKNKFLLQCSPNRDPKDNHFFRVIRKRDTTKANWKGKIASKEKESHFCRCARLRAVQKRGNSKIQWLCRVHLLCRYLLYVSIHTLFNLKSNQVYKVALDLYDYFTSEKVQNWQIPFLVVANKQDLDKSLDRKKLEKELCKEM